MELDEKDLKIDTFYDHTLSPWTNKLNISVLITHIPTGLSYLAKTEHSQHANKRKALDELTKLVNSKIPSFSNRDMKEPIAKKPHIALINGWWRVSCLKKETWRRYHKAHAFARSLNIKKENQK